MDIYCTRPNCPAPRNYFPTLSYASVKAAPLQFCKTCTMPLVLGGHYLPLDQLKAGIPETTFLAEDLHSVSGRRYVVRLLPARKNLTLKQLETAKERFRQEARTLEALGSEHLQIPSLYAYFELTVLGFSGSKLCSDQTEELFYLIEEYIDGQDLAQELTQKGQFRETEAIEILGQILPVLQFIHGHEYGVIHEEIRPENILRDRKGRLHLTNFGAVKRAITEAARHSPQQTAALAVPPEQQAGQYLPASDLYSLATTLLRLLTNQDLQSLFDSQTQTWNWRSYAQVSDRLANVLDKMLQPMPHQRFESATAVMAALAPETRTLPLSSTPTFHVAPEVIAALTQDSIREPSNGKHEIGVEQSARQIRVLPKPTSRKPETQLIQPEIIHSEITHSELIQPETTHSGTTYSETIDSKTTHAETIHLGEVEVIPENNGSKSSSSRASREFLPSNTRLESSIFELLRQAAILGSGGWFAVAALASFLGTVLASGLWLLILAGVVFGFLARKKPLAERMRLLVIAIASAGLTFLLVPQFFRVFSLVQALPQVMLLTLASGLFALILIVLSQLAYDFMPKK